MTLVLVIDDHPIVLQVAANCSRTPALIGLFRPKV